MDATRTHQAPSQAARTRDRMLSIKAICELVGCSPSTIRRAIRAGGFPKPITLGLRQLQRWPESQVVRALQLTPREE